MLGSTMALTVHASNLTERLVDALVAQLEARRTAAGPLEPVELIVPNDNMATYVKLSLAERSGIAANVRARRLVRFVRDEVRRRRSDIRLVDRELLGELVLSVLMDEEAMASEALRPVREWIDAADETDRRRVQLAARLSGLFEEYSFSRPAMVRRWLDGGEAQCPHASWQGALWRTLFGRTGLVAERSRPDEQTWVTVAELFDHVAPEAFADLAPVHVFGVSYVARTFHALLHRLAAAIDVHVYSLDARGHDGDGDPAGGRGVGRWDRPGREHLRLLAAEGPVIMDARHEEPDAGSGTLLERVQSDVVRGAPAGGAGGCAADGSVQLLACQSVRREAEVVSDEIWRLVEERPGLRFNRIAVLVEPGQRDSYMPHLEAAFAESHAIPHNIVDLPLSAESGVAEAALMLLDLPTGTFSRSEMAPLLVHPAFAGRAMGVDPDGALELCDALGIFHGADREDHAGTYIEEDVLNWDQGMRRVALGTFMTGERSGDVSLYRCADGEYVPHELGQSAAGAAARLSLLVRSLAADARWARGARLPLAGWARFIAALVETYVADPEGDEGAAFRCLSAVRRLERMDLGDRHVSWTVAAELARGLLEGLPGRRGQHLADGVVVSTLQPMRAIPFDVVFLTGMGEGLFPARDARDTLDLRAASARPGDVSPRQRDLYTLLETLLCARSRLYVSWVARDPLTGDELAPSFVVRELSDACSAHVPNAREALLRRTPLRRYDPRVPSDGTRHVDAARVEARLRALGDELRARTGRLDAAESLDEVRAALDPDDWRRLRELLSLPPPVESPAQDVEDREMSLSLVRGFLECPLQGSARAVLGVEPDADEDLLHRDTEPFAPHPLESVTLMREAFTGFVHTGRDLQEAYGELARRAELGGRMPTGVFGARARRDHLEAMERWHALLEEALGALPESLERTRLGRAEEHARVDRIEPAIELDVELERARSTVRVQLGGATELLAGDGLDSVTLLWRRPERRRHRLARHLLRGVVDHVALAAAGLVTGVERRAHVIMARGDEGGCVTTVLPPLGREEARAYLTRLVADMLGGVYDWLMPCEAVLMWHDGVHPTLARCVEALLDTADRSPFSSLYGPVPHPQQYPVAPEREARELVAHRFGPLFGDAPEARP
jgi:exodeoxyribonuclease V gamma subunit